MTPVTKKPKVIIVGAGLGGITLGILLEKAGIPYEIFERAPEVKPLGSAISMGASVLTFFEQLGLLEEFISYGKPTMYANMYNEKRELQNTIDFSFLKNVGGHYNYIVPRPHLYAMLLRQIPAERIRFSKRVLSISQGEHGVLIRTSDNMTHEGDILVGADGAYSSVRQGLYAALKKEKKLPSSDDQPLPFNCVALVGHTEALDPEQFPELLLPESCNQGVIGGDNKPYSLMTFTCQNNSMCWGLMHHLDAESSKMNDSFRNSEWGPEAAEQMCKEVRDFPIPGGINNNLTLGDLIDKTPQHLISKVMLEEKVFDTWFHGRTVLLGDACHKFNPAGGQGAVNAIQDAIALANWINTLNADSTWDETAKVFSEYRSERHPWAQHAFTDSQVMSKLVAMNFMGRVARYAAKNMPVWLQRAAFSRIATNRPQVAYLPLAPDRGQTKAVKQNSLIKTQKILATRAKKQQQ
ncbi:hypothetical protein BGZ52_011123 [Haplosporangium bisporale]|nr:hypothetical protein BGZ52_011123 [Haplosporangium bisporale]